MKCFFGAALLLVLGTLTISGNAFEIPASMHQVAEEAEALINTTTQMVRDHGCDPNICFALDGSRSISWREYQLQKDFVNIVAATISTDPEGTYAAVQYGTRNRRISPSTSNIETFLRAVKRSRSKRSDAAFITGGLNFCIRQLKRSIFDGEPKKIVLIGDGDTRFGAREPPRDPASIIARWLRKDSSHSVCGVGVKFSDLSKWEAIVGDPEHVFHASEWLELIYVLEDLVIDVCGWDELEF